MGAFAFAALAAWVLRATIVPVSGETLVGLAGFGYAGGRAQGAQFVHSRPRSRLKRIGAGLGGLVFSSAGPAA
jgi:hypothetical protein